MNVASEMKKAWSCDFCQNDGYSGEDAAPNGWQEIAFRDPVTHKDGPVYDACQKCVSDMRAWLDGEYDGPRPHQQGTV